MFLGMSRFKSQAKREVVVRLNSGLGNQLFQLAQGLGLAEQRNARLRYDTTWFRLVSGLHPVKRRLRLPELGVLLPEAFGGPRRLAVGIVAAFFDKTRRGKHLLSALGNMRVIQESAHSNKQDEDFANIKCERVYLNGYWQTNGSFMLIRNNLLPILKPRHPLSSGAEALIAKANAINTGFIHVRRGDYIHFMGDTGLLPVGYYSRSFSAMQGLSINIARWMIFSEDTAWAQANLNFIPNAEVVDYRSPNRDIEDLMIMKSCSAGIIANSSYSWWGAALGDRSDRPIITPDRYWKDGGRDSQGWALPEWIRVKAWD